MIDVTHEDLIDLPTAAKVQAFRNHKTGKPCHVAQLYRYIQRGAVAVDGSRVRLEVVKVPTGFRTTREAVARFVYSLTDPDAPTPIVTAANRRNQIDAARHRLAAAGM